MLSIQKLYCMEWFVSTLRSHPEIAIFLTLGLGALIGRIRVKGFSLGVVTSVLLVGVLMGQLKIPIGSTLKPVAFLLFLFAIGYKVGPQFFRGLRKEGLPQVAFSVVMCLFILATTWVVALLMGFNTGEAAGLLSGAQTISAVIGVADDTINGLAISATDKQNYISIIPVAYAVTYIYGTAGSAWIMAKIGPRMMGGFDKVRAACRELESKMGHNTNDDPDVISAERPVVFRAYKISNSWFQEKRTVSDLEILFESQEKRLFVERIRKGTQIINDITPDMKLETGYEVVLSGRREYAIGEEEWIGPEVDDEALLDFPIMQLKVLVVGGKRKGGATTYDGKSIAELRKERFMHGVSIRSITRMGVNIPVFPATTLNAGDTIELVGKKFDVQPAAKAIGYPDPATNTTDMAFLTLGVFIGCIIGVLTLHIGGVPLSLSTSGGALIAGLVFGWWHSRRPTMGSIPEAALWVFNNMGLNIFIAIVGITAGPSFVDGIREAGLSLFIAGIIATSLPLFFGILISYRWFKFHPAIALGCCCGARTTTAAVGAVQEAVGSETPALGYTVTYAVGNTLLILWGVIIVLLIH